MIDNKDDNENVKTQFPKHLVDYTPVLNIVESDTCAASKNITPCGVKAHIHTLDLVVTTVLVTPLVIGQWRGTWMLTEYYRVPWWASFLTGTILHFLFALLKDILQDYFSRTRNGCMKLSPVILFVVSRTYTWVFGIACISHWRGIWIMLDEYTGRQISPVIAVSLVSLAMLSTMKTLRNISTSPFSIDVDGLEPGFAFPTMFRTSVSLWHFEPSQSDQMQAFNFMYVPSIRNVSFVKLNASFYQPHALYGLAVMVSLLPMALYYLTICR
jgi:hypothetical protein